MSSNHGQTCRDIMGKRLLIKSATVIDENRHLTIKSAKVNGNVEIGNGGVLVAQMNDQTGWNLYNKVRDATVSISIGGSSCSGWFVSPDGWIATAAHCVTDNQDITNKISPNQANVLVTSVDGVEGVNRFLEPTELYMDAAGDIAVMKIPGLTNQSYLEWGNSQVECIGNRCFVVGNPLGEDTQSLADGLIRETEYVGFPQPVESIFVSVPTFGGNSGSPIINEKCKVIGILTFGLTENVLVNDISDLDVPYTTIGFAFVPTETMGGGMSQRMAEPVVNYMIENTTDFTQKAWLGIDAWETVGVGNANELGLVGTNFNVQGIRITSLNGSSPLLTASGDGALAVDDVILSIDGVLVGDLPGQTHISIVSWFKIKTDTVTLTWVRPLSNLIVKTSTVTIADDYSDHPSDDAPLAGNLNADKRPKLATIGSRMERKHNVYSQEHNKAITTLINTNYTYRNPADWTGSETLTRLVASAYGDADGDVPSGADRPNPRTISNEVFDVSGDILPNPDNTTDYFWIWGQYLDHDIGLTESDAGDPFNISVPTGDPDFDPGSSGTVEIPFNRSLYAAGTGTGGIPREQISEITSFIDATNVYGTTSARSTWLRSGVDGKLKTSQGNLPPLNDGSQSNAGASNKSIYVCGDVRANENTALLSTHTLFLREHNWWCDQIKNKNQSLTDEEIYQKARLMVESEVQAITFNEFLPLLLGSANVPSYTNYNSGIDHRIANEFSAASYRLGHSLVSDTLWRLDANGQQLPIGHLNLKDAFFSPNKFANEGGIEPIIRGATEHICQTLDAKIVPALRNFLFGAPGSGGLDLAALNIQRGRDHGFPDYNTVRVALGLSAKSTFEEINSNSTVATALSTAYSGDISKVDLWVGGLAEEHIPGAMLGETFHKIVKDQFLKLRDGDPLWYENRLNTQQIAYVNSVKLSTIIMRNTNIRGLREYVMQNN